MPTALLPARLLHPIWWYYGSALAPWLPVTGLATAVTFDGMYWAVNCVVHAVRSLLQG